MAAPNITASTRYFRPGVTSIVFCTSVGTQASPTRAEINAGTDLRNEVAAIDGWAPTSEFLDAPDLGSRFTSRVAGRITADDSSLTFYASLNSVDVRSLLPRDTTGFILFMDEGDVSGRRMDVFKVTVASAPKQRSIDDVSQIQISFSITASPSENVVIPA